MRVCSLFIVGCVRKRTADDRLQWIFVLSVHIYHSNRLTQEVLNWEQTVGTRARACVFPGMGNWEEKSTSLETQMNY